MKKEWRLPFAFTTAAVLALSLSLVVFGALFQTVAMRSFPFNNLVLNELFAFAAVFILAWLVISWRRIRGDGDRVELITNQREMALSCIGIIFGASWIVSAAALQASMQGGETAFVFMGIVTGPWILIISLIWFWKSV